MDGPTDVRRHPSEGINDVRRMPQKEPFQLRQTQKRTGMGEAMICPRCSYEWEPRKPNPKVCPRCKGRLDWHVPKVTQSKQKEVK